MPVISVFYLINTNCWIRISNSKSFYGRIIMLSSFFNTCGTVIKIYSYLCIASILLSWIGQTSVTAILDEICAPYLNWFRRFKFTQIGSVDFSPILALGVLQLISRLFFQLAIQKSISPFEILFGLISILWYFFSFLINLFIILLVLRLIIDFIPQYRTGNFAYMLDKSLTPIFVRVHKLLGGKFMTLRKQVIVCIIILILVRIMLGALIGSGMYSFKIFTVI